MGLTPDTNSYRYAEGNSVRWTDPTGLEVPKYDVSDFQDCIRLLDRIPLIPDSHADMPCAKSLLRLFVLGINPGGSVCTRECKALVENHDWSRQFNDVLKREFWMRNGSCGVAGSIDLSFKNMPVTVERGESEDWYFAFHAFTLTTFESRCNWKCGNRIGCCCDCNATCGATLKVTDDYDFCSSWKPGPGFGNQLAKCGCIIEDYRKKHGKPSTFKVDCSGGTRSGINSRFKACESSYNMKKPW